MDNMPAIETASTAYVEPQKWRFQWWYSLYFVSAILFASTISFYKQTAVANKANATLQIQYDQCEVEKAEIQSNYDMSRIKAMDCDNKLFEQTREVFRLRTELDKCWPMPTSL